MSIGINSAYNNGLQNYRVPTIQTVSAEEVKKQDAQLAEEQSALGLRTYEETSTPAVRKPDAQLEDISVTFNKQDDFGYIGKDSDIFSLDVEKAVSDMQKDRMLQQYQYFVGSSKNLYEQHQSADGVVIPKF
jgi:hypothetical protein